jgi:peroxiredoxin Q/BCP
MSKVTVGKKAPDFDFPSSTGENIKLKDYLGKKIVVLYFYPKDDTPGCTVQACGLRDANKRIEKLDAIVLGVSKDTVSKHKKFIEKFDLPFILISDKEKELCQMYDILAEKSMYGKKYMGISRTTFIIGKDGKVLEVFENVSPKEHEDQVLSFLKSL